MGKYKGFDKEIIETVQLQFPGKNIKSVEDKGVWLKHIFKITFNDNTCIYVKLVVNDFSDIQMESNIDTSCSTLPYPYIIQNGGEGKQLSYYLEENEVDKLKQIFAPGQGYMRSHGNEKWRDACLKDIDYFMGGMV